MTRQEELVQAARKEYPEWEEAQCHFIDGAHYADSHPHWISVEDELPKKDGKYLIYTKSGQQIIVNYECHRGKWHQFNEAFFTPTHWMPLPEAPKEGGEK